MRASEIGDCLPDGAIDLFDVLTGIDVVLGREAPTTIQRVLCDVDCNRRLDLLDVLGEIDLLRGRLTRPLSCMTCGNATITPTQHEDDQP